MLRTDNIEYNVVAAFDKFNERIGIAIKKMSKNKNY